MKRIFFACTFLVFVATQSVLTVSETSGGFRMPQQKPKPTTQKPKPPPPKPKPNEGDHLNLLSMEVKALETLHNFKATVPQLKQLAQLAKSTKAKAEKLEPAQAVPGYANALKGLRDALIARDEDKIDKFQEELANIAEKSPPKLDDEFDITDAARQEAGRLYMKLSLRQMVLYADSFGEDLPDPVDVILQGVKGTHDLKGEDWKGVRDDLAEQISWLVGGSKREKMRSDVVTLLNEQHGKSTPEGELKGKIQKIVGYHDPLDLLRNLLKHDLALLLSNPQLEKAVLELLKNEKSKS